MAEPDTNHFEHSRPPVGSVPYGAKLIVEVGTARGEITRWLLDTFLEAHIIGIEMNPNTASLARAEIPRVDLGRCAIINAAVGWPERMECAALDGSQMDKLGVSGEEVHVVTMDSVFKHVGIAGMHVDYLKMDIEGAEWEILNAGGDWLDYTLRMLVEVHRDPVEETVEVIERAGFTVVPRLEDPKWNNHLWCVRSKFLDL